ncbi:secreted effector protein PipB2 [Actinokineospora sp. UTMC 2448]|nr:secreted effector protein PipB2 [Actinokineospora sp. UTMC 2448]
MKPPSTRAVAATVGGVVVVIGGLLTLLWSLVDGGSPQAPTQLELVRIGLTVLLGTGGLFGLYLAWRRQRSTEIGLAQKQQDQADVARAYELQRESFETTRLHQERVAAATERDAEARRITDLYTKAADQLGSDKAPVRLAGVYALERLAQDHSEQRQTIVNVLCAYLRMPYTIPTDPPENADTEQRAEHRELVQEREVRLAAQRILAHHLRPGPGPDNPATTFWADTDLDLTGATLVNLDLTDCTIGTARFRGATFTGAALFDGATFTGNASFHEAAFTGDALFDGATFTGNALFDRATFTGAAWFDGATFTGAAFFDGATFTGNASFHEAAFTGAAFFDGATFTGAAWFDGAAFTGDALFHEAAFTGNASFRKAAFTGNASFRKAAFTGAAWFDGATFTGNASFHEAAFTGHAVFDKAGLPETRYVDDETPSPWTDFSGARFEKRVPPEVEQFVSPSSAGPESSGEREGGTG